MCVLQLGMAKKHTGQQNKVINTKYKPNTITMGEVGI